MDTAAERCIAELGMDDYQFIHHCNMINSLADFTTQNLAAALGSESYSSYPTTFNGKTTTIATASSYSTIETSQTSSADQTPSKLHKTNSLSSHITAGYQSPKPSAPSSQILSFEASALPPALSLKDEAVSPRNVQFQSLILQSPYDQNPNFTPKANQGTKRPFSMTRSPSHAQDNIIAERKRREKLSQRLISLSALVPGLKKMDKASVLGDAIKYMKQLQERVKVLEEQTKKKRVESVILVKRSHPSGDDDSSSCDENNFDGSSSLPEIEARASDKDVLIRIHSKKQQGVLVKILNETENLHLSIINSTVLPFGNSTLDITIIAQMGTEYSMIVKDLAKNLRMAFSKFM